MITSKDLHFFSTLSRVSSLAEAARSLDVTPPAVSQRLRLLEERLDVQLVERVRGRLHLTPEGELLAERAADIIERIDDLSEAMSERRTVVSGPLRIIAPFGFGRAYVAPVMIKFNARFPNVTLNLTLCDAPYSAARTDSWDVLIHVGQLADSSLIQNRLAPNRRILCAAPAYLKRYGHPRNPGELLQHACGVIREDMADVTMWSFRGSDGQKKALRVRPTFAANDGEVVKCWAIAGMGIVERSEWDVASELQTGQLVEVMPELRMPDADVVALLSPRTQRVARTQRFVQMLRDKLGPPPWRVTE